jgi:hypothetical protein
MKYAKIKTYHLNGDTALEKNGDGYGPYLTLEKLYPIDIWDGSAFEITDNTGAMTFCLVTGCAHLGNGDWEIIEVEDE